jgi:hypothetical protein
LRGNLGPGARLLHQIVDKLQAINPERYLLPHPLKGDPAGIEAIAAAIKAGRKLDMIRKLKTLSLAIGAVFAMGAMMASTASAVDVFTNSMGKGSDLVTGVSRVPSILQRNAASRVSAGV